MTWVAKLAFLSGVALFLPHVVVLPNYQEDEAMLRETLEDTRRSPFAEKYMSIVLAISPLADKHMRIVLAKELFMAATTKP